VVTKGPGDLSGAGRTRGRCAERQPHSPKTAGKKGHWDKKLPENTPDGYYPRPNGHSRSEKGTQGTQYPHFARLSLASKTDLGAETAAVDSQDTPWLSVYGRCYANLKSATVADARVTRERCGY
jgi:hypothetical protein